MRILPLHPDLEEYLTKRRLRARYEKQKLLFETDIRHPGLNVELMEPKHLRIWSFRISKKYRAMFIFRDPETVEVIDTNNHYR
jgi:plasmid maintenance system killer protein